MILPPLVFPAPTMRLPYPDMDRMKSMTYLEELEGLRLEGVRREGREGSRDRVLGVDHQGVLPDRGMGITILFHELLDELEEML